MVKKLWAVEARDLGKTGCPYCQHKENLVVGKPLLARKTCPRCKDTFLVVDIGYIHQQIKNGTTTIAGCKVIVENGMLMFEVPTHEVETMQRQMQTFVWAKPIQKKGMPREQQPVA